ncbi:hypothetical protein LT493_39285 [Streptomyces tricolor]|nr:hypothetical protein [Streptomyces tricolor]
MQFAISGMPFTVTATELNGTGFEQSAGSTNGGGQSNDRGHPGPGYASVTSAIKQATLTSGPERRPRRQFNLLITAGKWAEKVSATDLTHRPTELSGDVFQEHRDRQRRQHATKAGGLRVRSASSASRLILCGLPRV